MIKEGYKFYSGILDSEELRPHQATILDEMRDVFARELPNRSYMVGESGDDCILIHQLSGLLKICLLYRCPEEAGWHLPYTLFLWNGPERVTEDRGQFHTFQLLGSSEYRGIRVADHFGRLKDTTEYTYFKVRRREEFGTDREYTDWFTQSCMSLLMYGRFNRVGL